MVGGALRCYSGVFKINSVIAKVIIISEMRITSRTALMEGEKLGHKIIIMCH